MKKAKTNAGIVFFFTNTCLTSYKLAYNNSMCCPSFSSTGVRRGTTPLTELSNISCGMAVTCWWMASFNVGSDGGFKHPFFSSICIYSGIHFCFRHKIRLHSYPFWANYLLFVYKLLILSSF